MSANNEHTNAVDHGHAGGLNTKMIWKVFWILLAITIFEVAISFTGISKDVLLVTFIALTIVKAYFIVGYFMHLKFEELPMKFSLLLPFILIVYLIFILIYEGTALGISI